jgi:hypothetical protein
MTSIAYKVEVMLAVKSKEMVATCWTVGVDLKDGSVFCVDREVFRGSKPNSLGF